MTIRMLLQTNSYIVPREKREEHARLVRKFRQTLHRLGCDDFEIYEQVGSNWSTAEATGRYVQIMRFRDRKHQQQVQAAEREDRGAQVVIREFCELINFPYQQQQGLFASGFYQSVLPSSEPRRPEAFKGKVAPVMPSTPTSPTPPAPAAPGEPMEPRAATEEQLVAREGDRQADAATESAGAEDAGAEDGAAEEATLEAALEGEALEGEAVEFDIDIDDETADDAIVDVLPPDDQAADGDATGADTSDSGERSRSR